jgi:hypothetical protein
MIAARDPAIKLPARRDRGVPQLAFLPSVMSGRVAEQEPAPVLRSGHVAGENSGDLAGALPLGVRR